MYPHSATPRIPTESPYNTKSSPPTAYARLARPHFHHLAQTHTHHTYPTSIPPNSTPESTRLQPIDPTLDHIKNAPTKRHTLPPPNQTHSHTSTWPNYPTIPTPYIIVLSKPSPLLPLYAHPAAKILISPSKAHMSLGRFCCALTIEYKCKTSHINKRWKNSNDQRLNTNVNYRM